MKRRIEHWHSRSLRTGLIILLMLLLASFLNGRAVKSSFDPESEHWFLKRYVKVSTPKQKVEVTLPLNLSRLTFPDSNKATFNIQVSEITGSGLMPRSFRLKGVGKKGLRRKYVYRENATMGALYSLTPGDYTVEIRSRGPKNTSGEYLVQVHLAGDVNADHAVNTEDISSFPSDSSLNATPSGFQDVNGDGKVNDKDVGIAQQNDGSSVKTISFTLTNTTGQTVYVGAYGPVADTPSDPKTTFTNYYFDLDGTSHKLAGQSSLPMVELTGTATLNIQAEAINSGRFVFSKDKALTLAVDAQGNVSNPDPDSTDNTFYYDFVEFTMNWPYNPSITNSFININTTTVDQFDFPIKVQLAPVDPNNPDGVGVILKRSDVFNKFSSQFPAASSPFSLCVINNSTETDTPYRVLAPQHVLKMNPAPSDPNNQLPGLKSYFDTVIDESFQYFENNPVTLYVKRDSSSTSGTSSAGSLRAELKNAESDNTAQAIILNEDTPIAKIGVGATVTDSGGVLKDVTVATNNPFPNSITANLVSSSGPVSSVWMKPLTFGGNTTFNTCIVEPPNQAYTNKITATLLSSKNDTSDLAPGMWVTGSGLPDFAKVDSVVSSSQVDLVSTSPFTNDNKVSLTFYSLLGTPLGPYSCSLAEPQPDFYVYSGKVVSNYKIEKTLLNCDINDQKKYTAQIVINGENDPIAQLAPGAPVTSTTSGWPSDAQIDPKGGSTSFPGPATVNLIAYSGAFPTPTGSVSLTFSGSVTFGDCTISKTAAEDIYIVTLNDGDCTGIYTGMLVSNSSISAVSGVTVGSVKDNTSFYLNPNGQSISTQKNTGLTCAWTDSSGSAIEYKVLQFTGQNGNQKNVTYQIFYPSFTGTPPPWIIGSETASEMVFACDGVFADNVGQFPLDPLGEQSTIQGNLENQIVSALNRGGLPRQVPITGSITVDAANNKTGTLVISNGDVSRLQVGMLVEGSNVPNGTSITSISGSTITILSQNALSAISSEAMTCTVQMITYLGSIVGNTKTPAADGSYSTTVTLKNGDTAKLHVGMSVTGAGVAGGLSISEITDSSNFTVTAQNPIGPITDLPLLFSDFYPVNGTWNGYSWFWHQNSVSIRGKAYGFPFDDNGGNSSDMATTFNSPTSNGVTISLEQW